MTKEYISTRPATADDAPAIRTMHRELAAYCEYPPFLFNISEDNIRATIANEKRYEAYFVAEHHYRDGYREQTARFSETVGFVYASRSPLSWNGERGVYIEDLYVHPEFRHGYGIGTRLLGCAAAMAIEFAGGNPDRAFLRLDTAANNNDATLRFYEGKGFDDHNTNLRLHGDAVKELACRAAELSIVR